MHPNILAKRQLDAQNRIMSAAQILAQRFGVKSPAMVESRQNDITQMLRWEAVATFLEALALVEPGIALADILAVEGLSKSSIAKLMETFGGSNDA